MLRATSKMKIKPVAIFDMDDTLCLFIQRVVMLIEQEFGMVVDPTELHEKWHRVFVNETHSQEFLSYVYNDKFYLGLEPRFNPTEFKKLLTKWEPYFYFEIITHRGDPLGANAATVTRDWLRSHGVADLFAHVKALKHRENKTSLAHPHAAIVFDDSLQVLMDFRTNRMDVQPYMVTNPWNIAKRIAGVPKVHHLADFDEALTTVYNRWCNRVNRLST